MTTSNRYDIQWVGNVQYGTHNKVWGWFFYNDPTSAISRRPNFCYTFWAGVGKTANFKKHDYFSNWEMDRLIKKKTDEKHGYKQITIEQLLEIWPTIYDDFDNKFIFNLLADSF